MKARFQADASLRSAIVDGVRRREPSIDFRSAHGVLPDGMADPDVLALATSDGRILVSHDVHTMPGHFADLGEMSGRSSGVFLIPQKLPISEAIEEIVLIWSVSEADEWIDQLVWLPL
jgi:hypothetical protein